MAYFNKKHYTGKGLTIIVDNNNINKAISQLKHLAAPKIKELKDKRYFEKPSEKKRRKGKERIRNLRKAQRLMEQNW